MLHWPRLQGIVVEVKTELDVKVEDDVVKAVELADVKEAKAEVNAVVGMVVDEKGLMLVVFVDPVEELEIAEVVEAVVDDELEDIKYVVAV